MRVPVCLPGSGLQCQDRQWGLFYPVNQARAIVAGLIASLLWQAVFVLVMAYGFWQFRAAARMMFGFRVAVTALGPLGECCYWHDARARARRGWYSFAALFLWPAALFGVFANGWYGKVVDDNIRSWGGSAGWAYFASWLANVLVPLVLSLLWLAGTKDVPLARLSDVFEREDQEKSAQQQRSAAQEQSGLLEPAPGSLINTDRAAAGPETHEKLRSWVRASAGAISILAVFATTAGLVSMSWSVYTQPMSLVNPRGTRGGQGVGAFSATVELIAPPATQCTLYAGLYGSVTCCLCVHFVVPACQLGLLAHCVYLVWHSDLLAAENATCGDLLANTDMTQVTGIFLLTLFAIQLLVQLVFGIACLLSAVPALRLGSRKYHHIVTFIGLLGMLDSLTDRALLFSHHQSP